MSHKFTYKVNVWLAGCRFLYNQPFNTEILLLSGAGHRPNLLQIRLVQLFFPNRIFCFTRECHNSYKAERTGITLGYIYIEIHVHLTVQRVYVRVLCTDQTALGYLPTGVVIRN